MPPRRSSTDARAEILDAARETFIRDGYAAATLEDIAAQVGMTRGAVLYHYGTKEEVLRAVVDPLFQALEAEAATSGHDPAPPRAAVQRERVAGLAQCLQTYRSTNRLLVRFTTASTTLNIGERLISLNHDLVRHLSGDVHDDPVALTRTMAALLCLTSGLASRTLLALEDEVVARVLTDCAMDVLRPGTAPREPAP